MSKRRGLVLEGGGAKGAYAYGCMLAFKEKGISFDAVSGTSVGALNGLLWVTETLKSEEKLWTDLSEETVFQKKLPKRMLIFLIFINIYRGIFSGLRNDLIPMVLKVLPYLIYSLGTIIVTAVTLFILFEELHAFGLILMMPISFLSFQDIEDPTEYGPRYKFVLIGILFVVIFVSYVFSGDMERLLFNLSIFTFVLPVVGFYYLYEKYRHMNIYDSQPLFQIVNRIMENPIRIPFYVTLGEEVRFYDPDKPNWKTEITSSIAMYELRSENGFFPSYAPIHKWNRLNGAKAVIASASLPLGIVNNVSIDNHNYVDGGMIDNRPIFPLLKHEKCEEIVIISLSKDEIDIEKEESRLLDIDRMERVRDFHPPETLWFKGDVPYHRIFSYPYWKSTPPKKIPYSDIEFKSIRFLILKPSENLGGFLSGTLKFNNSYAKKLVSLGRKDAENFLKFHKL